MSYVSKFDTWRPDIEKQFQGPYPLDGSIIEAIVCRRPAIYIWFVRDQSYHLGYVGRSGNVVDRLLQHARLQKALFFVKYCSEDKLEELESFWVDRAGDLNQVNSPRVTRNVVFKGKVRS